MYKKLREVEHNLSTIFRESLGENKHKVDRVREHDDKFGKNKKIVENDFWMWKLERFTKNCTKIQVQYF